MALLGLVVAGAAPSAAVDRAQLRGAQAKQQPAAVMQCNDGFPQLGGSVYDLDAWSYGHSMSDAPDVDVIQLWPVTGSFFGQVDMDNAPDAKGRFVTLDAVEGEYGTSTYYICMFQEELRMACTDAEYGIRWMQFSIDRADVDEQTCIPSHMLQYLNHGYYANGIVNQSYLAYVGWSNFTLQQDGIVAAAPAEDTGSCGFAALIGYTFNFTKRTLLASPSNPGGVQFESRMSEMRFFNQTNQQGQVDTQGRYAQLEEDGGSFYFACYMDTTASMLCVETGTGAVTLQFGLDLEPETCALRGVSLHAQYGWVLSAEGLPMALIATGAKPSSTGFPSLAGQSYNLTDYQYGRAGTTPLNESSVHQVARTREFFDQRGEDGSAAEDGRFVQLRILGDGYPEQHLCMFEDSATLRCVKVTGHTVQVYTMGASEACQQGNCTPETIVMTFGWGQSFIDNILWFETMVSFAQ